MATIRQKKTVKDIMENRGSVSAIMRKNGYSVATAKNPANLTRSKGFAELLPDYLLEEVQRGGLKATRKQPIIIGRDSKGHPEYDYVDIDDWNVRAKYLDMIYKVKGHYAPVKHLNINLKMTPEQRAKAKEAVRQALK